METFSALMALCVGIHRSLVNSPYKCQWRGALMFSLICVWINGWVNNREAGDLRRNQANYDVIVMKKLCSTSSLIQYNPNIISLYHYLNAPPYCGWLYCLITKLSGLPKCVWVRCSVQNSILIGMNWQKIDKNVFIKVEIRSPFR